MAWNSQRSACFCFLSTRIKGMARLALPESRTLFFLAVPRPLKIRTTLPVSMLSAMMIMD
ncbi:hypothetical protein LEMLEM_LOCUS18616 [Lemmus lemmus]